MNGCSSSFQKRAVMRVSISTENSTLDKDVFYTGKHKNTNIINKYKMAVES